MVPINVSLRLSSQHCVRDTSIHAERWKSCSCLCTLTSVRRGWNSHIEDSVIPSSHTSESQPLSFNGDWSKTAVYELPRLESGCNPMVWVGHVHKHAPIALRLPIEHLTCIFVVLSFLSVLSSLQATLFYACSIVCGFCIEICVCMHFHSHRRRPQTSHFHVLQCVWATL